MGAVHVALCPSHALGPQDIYFPSNYAPDGLTALLLASPVDMSSLSTPSELNKLHDGSDSILATDIRDPLWIWQQGGYGIPPLLEKERPPPKDRIYAQDPDTHSASRPPDPEQPPLLTETTGAGEPGIFNLHGLLYDIHYPNVLDPELDGTPYLTVPSLEHQLGWVYETEVNTLKQEVRRRKLVHIGMHPNYRPELDEHGNWVWDKVPGQYELVPGVPYVQRAKGMADTRETAVVLFDVNTMHKVKNGERAAKLLEELYELSFVGEDGKGIWDWDFIRNMRSANADGSHSGSYSLSWTKIEGEGLGLTVPSLQTRSPEEDRVRGGVLRVLGSLIPIVMRAALRREEYEALEFVVEAMNTPTFGSNENCIASSVQMNILNFYQTTAAALGDWQGKYHLDYDLDIGYTMFVCLFNNPEGA